MSELGHQGALSRRAFLVGMAGAAVTFGFAPEQGSGQESESSPFEPTIWYSVDRDGIVTVNITRAEMGQHIGTAVARILADELEVDWSKVRILLVDTDPKWGVMITGGSNSVWLDFPIYSRAGAAGRIALMEAGAKLLGVSPSQCFARQGAVFAANRSISYGEIVRRGEPGRKFTSDELAQLPIKSPSERRLIGKKADALDIPAKINGSARYGIDAAVEGMVYARPKLPPTRNGSVVRAVDDSAAKRVKGYVTSLVLEDPSKSCARPLIPRRSVPPTSSRSIGLLATPPGCPSRISSITAPSRSPNQAAARSWSMTRASMQPFARPAPRSSGPTRPRASSMVSSNR
jgi:CO/xanthine dehydrogenase Mo-binding subunit